MKTLGALIGAATLAAAVVLPFAASAEMSDTDYCNKLAANWREYVGSNSRTAGDVPQAVADCGTTPKTSIPVLEKVLTDNKISLPKR